VVCTNLLVNSFILNWELIAYRDDLVDNFSKHKDEVEKILAEGVKKVGLNGR
jgi:hypothetical protein